MLKTTIAGDEKT